MSTRAGEYVASEGISSRMYLVGRLDCVMDVVMLKIVSLHVVATL